MNDGEKQHEGLSPESHALLKDLLTDQGFGVLATDGQGQPYANLLAFAVSEDLRHVFLATPKNTSKHRNIMANPKVALLADNRPAHAEGIAAANAVTIIGEAKEVLPDELTTAREQYLAKHPELIDFLDSPDTVLLSLQVGVYILVNGLDQVSTLAFSD